MAQPTDIIMNSVNLFFASIPFSPATWFVLLTLMFFVWLFAKANKNINSPIRWEHLIIDSSNDRASPYKLGYLVGLIVATWIVVAMMDKDKLTFDIFGTYLTYLLGGAGVNSFVKKDEQGAKTAPKAAVETAPAAEEAP
jgi:MFS superfamily sulfate permease-like transporter